MEPKPKEESRPGSPNSSSSSQSDLSFSPTLKKDNQFEFPLDDDTFANSPLPPKDSVTAAGSFENESDSTSTGRTTIKPFNSTDSSSSTEAADKKGRFPKTPVSYKVFIFFLKIYNNC